MPHFDRFAYTDKRCYDMTAQDLGSSVPDRAAVTLQSYEIDALADYIAKIKGAGPITKGECIEFFGANAGTHCDTLPRRENDSGRVNKKWPACDAGHGRFVEYRRLVFAMLRCTEHGLGHRALITVESNLHQRANT